MQVATSSSSHSVKHFNKLNETFSARINQLNTEQVTITVDKTDDENFTQVAEDKKKRAATTQGQRSDEEGE